MPTDSDVPVALLSLWAPETEQLIFLHEMEIARVLLDVKRRQKLSSTFRNEPEAIEKSNLIARRGARGLIRAPRFEFRGGKSGQINFSLETALSEKFPVKNGFLPPRPGRPKAA